MLEEKFWRKNIDGIFYGIICFSPKFSPTIWNPNSLQLNKPIISYSSWSVKIIQFHKSGCIYVTLEILKLFDSLASCSCSSAISDSQEVLRFILVTEKVSHAPTKRCSTLVSRNNPRTKPAHCNISMLDALLVKWPYMPEA